MTTYTLNDNGTLTITQTQANGIVNTSTIPQTLVKPEFLQNREKVLVEEIARLEKEIDTKREEKAQISGIIFQLTNK